jgi:hypothetical protein
MSETSTNTGPVGTEPVIGMNTGHVEAYAVSTGARQTIPKHWLDHPVLGQQFTLDDPAAAAAEKPSTSWNNDRITDYAAKHEINLGDATTKAEMLAAIDAHPNPA